ncbi:hypothetical protein COO60DRAFT_526623 [Scenedesmus sp. NREL 46B-D3]|nr:hypothetical protein COO60DRAFT_526623 [Scenedesmus sp. NREL 46B-D3]
MCSTQQPYIWQMQTKVVNTTQSATNTPSAIIARTCCRLRHVSRYMWQICQRSNAANGFPSSTPSAVPAWTCRLASCCLAMTDNLKQMPYSQRALHFAQNPACYSMRSTNAESAVHYCPQPTFIHASAAGPPYNYVCMLINGTLVVPPLHRQRSTWHVRCLSCIMRQAHLEAAHAAPSCVQQRSALQHSQHPACCWHCHCFFSSIRLQLQRRPNSAACTPLQVSSTGMHS